MTNFLCSFLTRQYDITFRDLSFNKFSGTIPSTYADINSTFMYEIRHKFSAHYFQDD